MKIQLKNLGILKTAEFELGNLTVICGRNNTGKTYATYALYGFLTFFQEAFVVKIEHDICRQLLDKGAITVDLQEYMRTSDSIVAGACSEFTKKLPLVFASSEKLFGDAQFSIQLAEGDVTTKDSFERTLRSAKRELFQLSKTENETSIEISLLIEKEKVEVPLRVLEQLISGALKDILFASVFPHPFIASAERTGAAIFRKELNFARNRLLEQLSSMERDLNPFELLDKVYRGYALPVRRNVDFTRQLEDVAEQESFIATQHPGILHEFADIIGGKYRVVRDELYYVPRANKQLRLTMHQSSSAVRSLLDIGFYLRHVAEPGNLLIVDEPELNLHPENQRRLARLFARLVNIGIKVFITTHSDYIIKELNTLIMLKPRTDRMKKVMEQYHYTEAELLSPEQVQAYYAGKSW